MKDEFFQRYNPQDHQDELSEFHVDWLGISIEEIEQIEKKYWEALESATREEDMQQFLKENPYILIRWLSGGHGRWVLPKPKFGERYIPDFLVSDEDSIGYNWKLVELESPTAKMFTRTGDFTQVLNHAIRQVSDWREWIKQNISYAQKPKRDGGLGLINIDSNAQAYIIIGRRSEDVNPNSRRQYAENGIFIHSYEWLLSNPTIWPKTSKESDAD
jgi:hypothetical protein